MSNLNPRGNDLLLEPGALVQQAVYGLFNEETNYIADKVFPNIESGTEFNGENMGESIPTTGTIARFAANSFFGHGNERAILAPKAQLQVSRGPSVEGVTYACQHYAQGALVGDIEALAARNNLSVDYIQASTRSAVDAIRRARELHALDLLRVAGNWAGSVNLAGADQWDENTSDPIDDIDVGVENIAARGGKANIVVCTPGAFRALRKSAQFLENRDMTSDRTIASMDRVAALLKSDFGIESFHVARTVRNTATDPDTFTPAYLAQGEWFWIGEVPHLNGAAGRLGSMTRDQNGGMVGMPSARSAIYRVLAMDTATRIDRAPYDVSDLVTVQRHEAFGILQPELGYLINTPV